MADKCSSGHVYVQITPNIRTCECGPTGKGSELKGTQGEIKRLVKIAGGLDALRAKQANEAAALRAARLEARRLETERRRSRWLWPMFAEGRTDG